MKEEMTSQWKEGSAEKEIWSMEQELAKGSGAVREYLKWKEFSGKGPHQFPNLDKVFLKHPDVELYESLVSERNSWELGDK